MVQPTKVVVFGASGRTGKPFIKQALEQGLEVTAFVRTPSKLDITHPSLRIITGDAMDKEAVSQAIVGQDAVVSCLGGSGMGKSTALTDMTSAIVQGMQAHGVRRILYVASAGIHKEVPGMFGWIVQMMLRNVLADHRGATNQFVDGDLTYTIARPLRLIDGELTGMYRMEETGVPRKGSQISREDVAHFLLQRLNAEPAKSESVGLAY